MFNLFKRKEEEFKCAVFYKNDNVTGLNEVERILRSYNVQFRTNFDETPRERLHMAEYRWTCTNGMAKKIFKELDKVMYCERM